MKLPSKTEMNLIFALGTNEISGREVAKAYQKETGSAISYGTLYTTLRRLKEAGWVESRDDGEGDARVRFFKISGPGLKARAKLYALRDAQNEFVGGEVAK